jgi:hypothetical protein
VWKLIATAMKGRSYWTRLPPERRKQIVDGAAQQVKTHGPTVARAVERRGTALARAFQDAVKNAREEAKGKPPPGD